MEMLEKQLQKKLEDKSVLIQIAQNEHNKEVRIIMLEMINEL